MTARRMTTVTLFGRARVGRSIFAPGLWAVALVAAGAVVAVVAVEVGARSDSVLEA